MSPSTVAGQAFKLSSALWTGTGRQPVAPPGLWVAGQYEPHLARLATAQADVGARMLRSGMTVNSTNPFTPTNGAAYSNTVFTGKVTMPTITTGATFTDCFFAGTNPTTSDGGQVDARAGAGTSGARWDFLHCTFRPDSPNAWTDNAIGHHMRFTSCLLRDGVDGIGSYNTNGTDAQNEVYGCYIARLNWYYPDPTGDHADGTHNDCIQHQGGVTLWVVGNSLHGYVKDKTGNSLTQPNPQGSAPNYKQCGQGILVQQNPPAGASSDVHLNNNWLWGCEHPIKLSSTNGLGNVIATGNRWMDFGAKDFGGSQHYYWFRFDSAVSLNGATYTGGNNQQLSPSADDNRWGVAGTNAFATVAVGDLMWYRVDP